jgi:hypothetical protein
MAEVTALMSGLIRTEAAIDADDRAATAPVGDPGRGRELGSGDVGKRLAPPGEQRVPQDPRVAGGQRAGRDDTPGVQGQQRQQNPQLTAAGMDPDAPSRPAPAADPGARYAARQVSALADQPCACP